MPADHNLVSVTVASTPSKSSNSLQHAKSRLESAVERLERTIEARARASQAVGEGGSPELEAARAEIRQLRETNRVVSTRLDTAIGKMKVLVEE